MTKQEFLNKIMSCQGTTIGITIEGWLQSAEYQGGINPFCNDRTWCGIIIDSEEPSFIGKMVQYHYHGSHSGTYRSWTFLPEMENCPQEEKFVPSEKLHDAGTYYTWEQGQFKLALDVSYKQFPDLIIWEKMREEFSQKIDRAIATRSKPGIKFGFHNWGYKRNSFSESPYLPGEVERQHYFCGCVAEIVFFQTWKKDYFHPHLEKVRIDEIA